MSDAETLDFKQSLLPTELMLTCSSVAVDNYAAVLNVLSRKPTQDINKGDKNGHTALHYACLNGSNNSEVIRLLLFLQADVCRADICGNTPLHTFIENSVACDTASSNLQYQLTRLLLMRREVKDMQNNEGTTPLHYAVRKKLDCHVRALLAAGANCNICDSEGRTPIYYVHSAATAAALWTYGAVIDVLDSHSLTPLQYIQQRSPEDVGLITTLMNAESDHRFL